MLHGLCRRGNIPRGYEIGVNLEVISLLYGISLGCWYNRRGPKTEDLGRMFEDAPVLCSIAPDLMAVRLTHTSPTRGTILVHMICSSRQ